MASDGRTIRELERNVNELQGVKTRDELGQMEVEQLSPDEQLSYINIASALAHRYDSIYYIDLTNDHYIEYVSSSSYKELKVETGGDDFFADSARNIRRVVHPDDIPYALHLHDKQFILKELEKDNLIVFTYRIMFDGVPHYYHGRMTRNINDPNHLIIGWANVDTQIQREKELEEAQSESYISRSITQALLSDYTRVFYVNIENEEYIEWTPDRDTLELVISGRGSRFFDYVNHDNRRTVYPPDLAKYGGALSMQSVLELLKEGPFACYYRIKSGDQLIWHSLKIVYAAEKSHILISIRDVNEQKRREADYENQLLNMSVQMSRDVLTNLKNKFAYVQMEQYLNGEIDRDRNGIPFGIAVLDINDLKIVNDTQGHKAGDQLIIDAARRIGDIFKHSPVFRIGGDEFAVVLTGRDYDRREALVREVTQENGDAADQPGISLACGLSVFDPQNDQYFDDVFARADQLMYDHKRACKARRA